MLKKIIRDSGDVIMAAVAIVFGLAVLAGSATAAEVPTEAPTAATAVHNSRDHAPELDAPFYAVRLFEDDSDPDTLPQLNAPTAAENDAFGALIHSGARGAMNDKWSAVYVRVGTVLDTGAGTVTVTTRGPAICMDNTERSCTGREFLTPEWQSY